MKLYRYIGFDKPWWNQPLLEGQLYFSSIEELRKANDLEEFDHRWNTSSIFFAKHGHVIESAYKSLFAKARILCMAKQFGRTLWKEFCPKGGVCYEFDFIKETKSRVITSSDVRHAKCKDHNVPNFVTHNCRQAYLRRLLAKRSALSRSDLEILNKWLLSDEPRSLTLRHIRDELTFKKLAKFRHEREFRYIRPSTPTDAKVTPMNDNKLDFSTLGLSLVRIHTDNIALVAENNYSQDRIFECPKSN